MSTTPALPRNRSEEASESTDSDFEDDLELAVERPAAAGRAAEGRVAAGPEGNLIPNTEEIRERLKDVIKNSRKGLRNMYGETEHELDENLREQTGRGEQMARNLIMMGCPRVIAKDLTVLTLYDMAILIGMLWCAFLRACFAYS